MNVVLDFQEVVSCRIRVLDSCVPDILGVLYQCWAIIQVASRVDIKIYTFSQFDNGQRHERGTDTWYDNQVSLIVSGMWNCNQNRGVYWVISSVRLNYFRIMPNCTSYKLGNIPKCCWKPFRCRPFDCWKWSHQEMTDSDETKYVMQFDDLL